MAFQQTVEMSIIRLTNSAYRRVADEFAQAGLKPSKEVLQRCTDRALEFTQMWIPGEIACDAINLSDSKALEDASIKVLLRGIRKAVIEADEFERFNPAFCPGQKYNVCEGRDN